MNQQQKMRIWVKSKAKNNKYAWVTHDKKISSKKFFISVGYKKKDLQKLRRQSAPLNKGNKKTKIARILTRNQVRSLLNAKRNVTIKNLRKIAPRMI